jgi:hypothetical protein
MTKQRTTTSGRSPSRSEYPVADTTSTPSATVGGGRTSRVRRWMTSSLAVVMASLAGTAALAGSLGSTRSAHAAKVGSGFQSPGSAGESLVRYSPYGVEETVRRIQQTAAEQGLPVLASIGPQSGASAPVSHPGVSSAGMALLSVPTRSGGPEAVHDGVGEEALSAIPWVIVFTSSEGGTPVVMDPNQPAPEVPLAVHVREGPDGRAVVELPRVDWPLPSDAQVDWPDTVVDELAGLPLIVDLALDSS